MAKKKTKTIKKSNKKLVKKRVESKSKSKKNSVSGEDELVIKVSKYWAKKAYVNKNSYQKKYNHSVKKNDDFWRKEGKRITWIKPYKKIKDVKYSKTDVKIKCISKLY